jgi:hypothetical protein
MKDETERTLNVEVGKEEAEEALMNCGLAIADCGFAGWLQAVLVSGRCRNAKCSRRRLNGTEEQSRSCGWAEIDELMRA